MKAIVLAAGRGERMRPLTDRVPKPLLRAGGRSLIEWQILRLVRAGVTQIVVNVSHFADQIEQALGRGEQFGAHIEYSQERVALETAGGITQALSLLGAEPFIAVNADIYCEYDYARLKPATEALTQTRVPWAAYLVLVPNPEHHLRGDFSLASDGVVRPNEADSLTFSGIGVYQPWMFSGIADGERQALGPMLHAGARTGIVRGERFEGRWMDIGTPQRLARLQALLGEFDERA